MTSVFDYTDYRKILADYYVMKKAENSRFSYQVFAAGAGFKDKSCIYSIMRGTRNLSRDGGFRIARLMKLKRYEAEYFENLIAFNQAEGLAERNLYFDRLCAIRARGRGASNDAQKLHRDQFDFYSQWYNVAIRSLIEMHGFSGDFAVLARSLHPVISSGQARQAVRLLQRLGLVNAHADGSYRATGKSLTTGKDVMSTAVENFHAQCADLAKSSVEDLPSSQRNVTGLTLGISEDTYRRMCDEIQYFQRRLMEMADSDERADKVYQLNFHFFPMTAGVTGRKTRS